MLKLSKDIYASIVLIIVSIVMYIASNSIVKITVSKIGADFAPKLVAIGIFVLSIFYLINSIKQLKASKEAVNQVAVENDSNEAAEEKQKIDPVSILTTVGLLIAYIALLPHIGFLITTAVYLFFQMYFLAEKKERKIPLFAIISVVTSVSVYYVFKSIFYLMLPAGILG